MLFSYLRTPATNSTRPKAKKTSRTPFIQALGLKGYTKGLIDIQTKEIWLEAKDTAPTGFTQPPKKIAQGNP